MRYHRLISINSEKSWQNVMPQENTPQLPLHLTQEKPGKKFMVWPVLSSAPP